MLETQNIETEKMLFIDEVSTDERSSTREFRWGLRGARVSGRAVFLRGQRYSSIGVLSAQGLLSYHTVEGSYTSEKLLDFADECLVCFFKWLGSAKNSFL